MAKKLASDRLLFTAFAALTVVGLVMVYSASAGLARGEAWNPFFVRQLADAVVGFGCMVAAMHVPYGTLREQRVIQLLIAGAVILLLLVLTQPPINGSRRWFLLGPISVQASELAKLAVVPFLAYQIDRANEEVNRREFLVPTLFVLGLISALILAGRDLGSTVLLVAVAAILIFLAGLAWRSVIAAGLMLALLLALGIWGADYRRARLLAFLSPESDPLGSGYQALQSLIAIGSGGLFGRGPGESVAKLYYLPHPESDFIFSIVAEELGLIGSLALLALFGVVLWRGVRAGLRSPDRFGRYLAWGLTSLIIVQALINVGVAIAILPTKGIPLPFISYGGSSLVVSMTLAGMLLSVSEHG